MSRLRAHTRTLLIDAALAVFARKTMRVPAIHEIAAQAGVATGTFYNYFRTCEELLEAAVVERFDRLQDEIRERYADVADPAERVSIGVRLFVLHAEREPMWAAGVLRLWMSTPETLIRMLTLAVDDLRSGRRQRRFTFRRESDAIDLAIGTAAAAMRRVLGGRGGAAHGAAMAALILRGLGVDDAEADTIVRRPLPPARPGKRPHRQRSESRGREHERRRSHTR